MKRSSSIDSAIKYGHLRDFFYLSSPRTMPQVHKRTTDRGCISNKAMLAAVLEVIEGKSELQKKNFGLLDI